MFLTRFLGGKQQEASENENARNTDVRHEGYGYYNIPLFEPDRGDVVSNHDLHSNGLKRSSSLQDMSLVCSGQDSSYILPTVAVCDTDNKKYVNVSFIKFQNQVVKAVGSNPIICGFIPC
jgi:hypothetical protein